MQAIFNVLDPRNMERLETLYGGLALLGCLPGSPAARAGLRWGDIVISVNGTPTPDIDAFIAAKGFRNGRMSVTVVRDGKELHVELQHGNWNAPTMEEAARQLMGPPGEAPAKPTGTLN